VRGLEKLLNGKASKRIRELEALNKALEIQCDLLIRATEQERVRAEQERVRADSAQRGLINYMREHGLADRIAPAVLESLGMATQPNDH
jgi:hypothetical protein